MMSGTTIGISNGILHDQLVWEFFKQNFNI